MGDSDDETFVKFGTGLDPFEDDEVPRKKPVTIQDQYATDERGRRRFHGAFTGGFSAGYFNTVGTRDGWQPQQFKSSRSSKAESRSQKPQDFMDDEDTGEFGIAPSSVRTTDSFNDDTKKHLKRIRSRQINDQPIPGTPVLQDFLVPARERIGIKLLKKMGWKPGQGIGPRVTKREKQRLLKQNDIAKKYGCLTESITKPTSESESDDDYAAVTLAPSDYEVQKPVPIDNYFGIGYVGLSKDPVLSKHVTLFDEPTLHLRDKNKKLSIRGQAFGVGAFEAADEDIYSRDDMSQYDFSLGPAEKKKSRWSQKKPSSSDCLEGFARAKKSYSLPQTYEPPVIPRDFVATHTFRQSRFYPPIEAPSTSKVAKPVLNATSRARILSDSPSSAAQNTIVRVLNLHGKEQTQLRQQQQVLEAQKAKMASMSWMDKIQKTTFVSGGMIDSEAREKSEFKKLFAYDADKQKRFDEYLEMKKKGEESKLASLQPLSMSEVDREQEKTEFEQAVKLQGTNKVEEKAKEEVPIENLGPEDAMKRAAKMKMFGKLTRRTEVWQPSSIVCKRFNIPEPSVGCAKPEAKKKGYSVFEKMDWSALSKFEKSSKEETAPPEMPQETAPPVMETEQPEVEKSEKEKLFQESYQKVFQPEEKKVEEEPSNLVEKKDLFKSIFLSSSEDEESEPEAELKMDDEAVKSVLLGKPIEVNVQRNDSPPRGIFAKIDLDELRKTKKPESKDVEKDPVKEVEISSESGDEVEEVPETYGPMLPAKPQTNLAGANAHKHIFRTVAVPKVTDLSDDGRWVEKSKVKKAKKEKKKHKHKEKEKEKRKKSKKKKH